MWMAQRKYIWQKKPLQTTPQVPRSGRTRLPVSVRHSKKSIFIQLQMEHLGDHGVFVGKNATLTFLVHHSHLWVGAVGM